MSHAFADSRTRVSSLESVSSRSQESPSFERLIVRFFLRMSLFLAQT